MKTHRSDSERGHCRGCQDTAVAVNRLRLCVASARACAGKGVVHRYGRRAWLDRAARVDGRGRRRRSRVTGLQVGARREGLDGATWIVIRGAGGHGRSTWFGTSRFADLNAVWC